MCGREWQGPCYEAGRLPSTYQEGLADNKEAIPPDQHQNRELLQ